MFYYYNKSPSPFRSRTPPNFEYVKSPEEIIPYVSLGTFSFMSWNLPRIRSNLGLQIGMTEVPVRQKTSFWNLTLDLTTDSSYIVPTNRETWFFLSGKRYLERTDCQVQLFLHFYHLPHSYIDSCYCGCCLVPPNRKDLELIQ